MDKKLKANWVKALRSGKYQQCRTQLTNGSGYCCLGVLAAVAGLPLELAYEEIGRILGEREMEALYGVNDDESEPPFEVIAGLIHEAL